MKSFERYKEQKIEESLLGDIIVKAKNGVTCFFDKVKNVLLPAYNPVVMNGFDENGIMVLTGGKPVDVFKLASKRDDEILDKSNNTMLRNLNNLISVFSKKSNAIQEAYGDALSGFGKRDNYTGEIKLRDKAGGRTPTNLIPDVEISDVEDDLWTIVSNITSGGAKGRHFANPHLYFGSPGVGKTTVVKAFVDSYNALNKKQDEKIGLIYVDCSHLSPESFTLMMPTTTVKKKSIIRKILGFLDKEQEDKYVESVPNAWLPCYKPTGDPEIDKKENMIANGNVSVKGNTVNGGIILLDELLRVQNGNVFGNLMSIINERQIQGWQIGDKWSFVMLSNRPNDDKAIADMVEEAPPALFDRCTVSNVIPNMDQWLKWGRRTGYILPQILDFVEQNPEYFCTLLDNSMKSGELIGSSPRKWQQLSENLVEFVGGQNMKAGAHTYNNWLDLPQKKIHKVIKQTVGIEIADAMIVNLPQWIDNAKKHPADNDDDSDSTTDNITSFIRVVKKLMQEEAKSLSRGDKNTLKSYLYNMDNEEANRLISKLINLWEGESTDIVSSIAEVIANCKPDLKGRIESYI